MREILNSDPAWETGYLFISQLTSTNFEIKTLSVPYTVFEIHYLLITQPMVVL